MTVKFYAHQQHEHFALNLNTSDYEITCTGLFKVAVCQIFSFLLKIKFWGYIKNYIIKVKKKSLGIFWMKRSVDVSF